MYVTNYACRTAENIVVGIPKAGISLAENAFKTAVGVVASAVSVCTLGLIERVNSFADTAYFSDDLVTIPFKAVGRVINPDYAGNSDDIGIFTKTFAVPFLRGANRAGYSENFFVRHVVSRMAYGLFGAAAVATRVADFALGCILAAVSIIPLFARVETINTLALVHLASTAVIGDVCRAVRGVINPGQFVVVLRAPIQSL